MALDLDEESSEPGTVLAIEWPENIKKWLTGKKIIKVLIVCFCRFEYL
jgi:tRNA A37 threonylcarbamoyladenosine biosynthesis protein TsaE